MAFVWDPEQGQWVETTEEEFAKLQDERTPEPGMSLEQQGQFNEQEQARLAQLKQAQGLEAKPFLSGNIGDIAADAALISGNALTGLVTDVGDLISYAGDVVNYGATAAFAPDKLDDVTMFDDTDNAWTQWRINTFEKNYRTEAAEAVGGVVRLASFLVPWGAPKVFGTAAKLGKGVGNFATFGKGERIAGAVTGAAKKALGFGLDDAAAAVKEADDVLAMADTGVSQLVKTLKNGSEGAKKAVGSLKEDWWLRAPLKELSSSIRKQGQLGNGLMDDIDRYVGGVRDALSIQLSGYKAMPTKIKLKTLGEAVAWDMFGTFSTAGEGSAGMDDTIADTIITNFGDLGAAGWLLSGSTTYVEDSALTKKLKGTFEGLVAGTALNVAFDTARIWRYSKNFRKASPEEQRQIIDAFSREANDIGITVSDLSGPRMANADNAGSGGAPDLYWLNSLGKVGDGLQAARQNLPPPMLPRNLRGGDLVPPNPLFNAQADPNQVIPASVGEMPPGAPGALPPGQVGGELAVNAPPPGVMDAEFTELAPDGAPQLPPGQQTWGEAGVQQEIGAPQPGMDFGQPIQPVRVDDIRPRPREPVVTPQTIYDSFQKDLRQSLMRLAGSQPQELLAPVMEQVTRMLPRTRTDALDYLKDIGRKFNDERILPLMDGLISDAVYQKGLAEGWIRWSPDGDILSQQRGAVDADEFDLMVKQGDSIEMANSNIDIAESFRAAQQEQPIDVDVAQSAKAAEQELDIYDQMAQDGLNREAVGANDQLVSYQKAQDERAMAAPDIPKSYRTDNEVLREFLGQDVPVPDIIPAETGKGYLVVDETGEVLGQARTQKGARDIQNKAVEARRNEMVRAARQVEEDGEFLSVRADDPLDLSSSVTGKIQFTDAQMRMVGGLDPELSKQLDEAWGEYTGGSGFFNPDGKKLKRTYELNQLQMNDLAKTIRQGVEEGTITGSRVKPLLNLADKLDTGVKLLSKEASTQKWAESIVEGSIRLLTDGKICELF